MKNIFFTGIVLVSFVISVHGGDLQGKLLTRPYAPMMAPMGPWQPGPEPTDALIRHFADTYRMINSHGGVVDPDRPEEGKVAYWGGPSFFVDDWNKSNAERMKKLNPDFLMSNYRNGSYIQQNCPQEAREVESSFPLGIAVWQTRLHLSKAIDSDTSELAFVAPTELPKNNAQVWPFKVSTTDEEYSKSPKEYVSWLRIGDEIMRIDKAVKADGQLNLTVRRGYWKTNPAAHSTEDDVLMPVYIGSVTSGGDVALSGVPDNKSKQLGIRYALQQQNKDFHAWLEKKCQRIFDEGYDVTWLDVATSAMYNNGDAYGNLVAQYDLDNDREMTPEQYCEYQQIKFDAMFEAFPDRLFFVNNIKGSSYFENGRERRLLSGEGGHHPVSGGSMENYAIVRDERDWIQVANMTLDFINSDFDGVAWSKTKDPMDQYHLFAYCTYLLAWKPREKLMFGGQWIRDNTRPEKFFYYDLGGPRQDFNKIAEAAMAGTTGVYSREFEKGTVIVNPSATEQKIPLDKRFFNPSGGLWVNEITLPSQQAAILLTYEISK